MGEGYTIAGASMQLQDRLNQLASEYNFINPTAITIDRHETSVSNSTRVYAIQMLQHRMEIK